MNSNGAKINRVYQLWKTQDEMNNNNTWEMDAEMFEQIKQAHGIN